MNERYLQLFEDIFIKHIFNWIEDILKSFVIMLKRIKDTINYFKISSNQVKIYLMN